MAGGPFSATVDIVSTQLLPNGTTVTRTTVNHTARDSAGRIYNERVVCFDHAGKPLFEYVSFAEQQGLPMIDDCYAMNVTPEGDIWLNYSMSFPLVRVRNFRMADRWDDFGSMGDAFCIRDGTAIYREDARLQVRTLTESSAPSIHQLLVDEAGNHLRPLERNHLAAAARGSSFVPKTGKALYKLLP